MEKICKECLISKTLDQFREQRKSCKKCSNKKTNDRNKLINQGLLLVNDKNIFDEININKKCTKCDETKNINDFRHGRSYCKNCENKKTVINRLKKKEEALNDTKNSKICIKCDIEKINTNFSKTGGNICNDCDREYHRSRHNGLLDIKKVIINDNNEKQCSKCDTFKQLDNYINGNNMCHECRKSYYTDYFKNNIIAKIKNNLGTHMRTYFKKENATFNYINLEKNLFRKWFEFLYSYDEYINDENHGSYWEIDHVVPCKLFDMSNLEEIKLCYNWKNLQCLSAYLNCKKNKYIIYGYILKQEIIVRKFNKIHNIESENEINKYYSRICAMIYKN